MIDIFERMGGGPVAVDEVPYYYYYPYGTFMEGGPGSSGSWFPGHPFSASSLHQRGNNGTGGYFFYNDGDVQSGDEDDGEIYFVDVPTRQGAGVPRKRKLNRESAEASEGGNVLEETRDGNSDRSFTISVEGRSKILPSMPVELGADSAATLSPPVGENVDTEAKTGREAGRLSLSLEEAAVVAQSYVRGSMVRRKKPLEQLRLIAVVRAQLAKLEQKMADPDFIEYAREHVTGRLKLSETIMTLLFQLDGILGVNSEVRDIRKSLTRKVIAFQEMVDKLFSGKEDDIMDVDMKHANVLPKTVDDVREVQASAKGDENQPMEMRTSQTSTVETHENLEAEVESGEMNVDVSHHGGHANVQYLSAGMEIDSMEGGNISPHYGVPKDVEADISADSDAPKFASGRVDALREGSAIDTLDSEVGLKGNERDYQIDEAVNVRPSDNTSHVSGDQEAREVPTLKASVVRRDDGVSTGSLEDWIDVHVDDRTSRQEGNAVDTTMERDVGEEQVRIPIPSGEYSDKKHDQEHVWTTFRDNEKSPFKFGPANDITAGAATIDSRFLANPQKASDLSLDGKRDQDALLQRRSDENQLLKSLLLGVIKWNQLQAGSINELSTRLGNLEKHFLKSSCRTRKIADNEYKQLTRMLE